MLLYQVRVGYAKVSDDGELQEGGDLSLLGQQEALHHAGSHSPASSTPKGMHSAGAHNSPFQADAMAISSNGRQGSLSMHSRKSSSSSLGGLPPVMPHVDRRDSAGGSSSRAAADTAAFLGLTAPATHTSASTTSPAEATNSAAPQAAGSVPASATGQQQQQQQPTPTHTAVRAPVSVAALESHLGNLSGPATARAEAAAAHQEQLLQQLAQQISDANRREGLLGSERRSLLAQCAQVSSRAASVEAKQSAAVEVEDFEAAAQLDGELQLLAR